MSNEMDGGAKLLEKLHTRYFMGKAVPMYERDRSKLRWLFAFLFLVGFGVSLELLWMTAFFCLIGIIVMFFYYSNRIENYYVRRFRRQNFYNIEKETLEINSRIEAITKGSIPNVDPDAIIPVLLDGFKIPDDSTKVQAFTKLFGKSFKFADILPYSCDSAYLGDLMIYKEHGYLVCSIQAQFKDESGNTLDLGSYYKYLS